MGKEYYDDLDPRDPHSTSHLMRRIDDERFREIQNRLDLFEGNIARTERKIQDLNDKFDEHDSREEKTRAQILQVIAMKDSAAFGARAIAWIAVTGASIVAILTWFWNRPQ